MDTISHRYTRKNIKAHASIGKNYQAHIPPFLRNRPPTFVSHCMEKMELGQNIPYQDIIEAAGGVFEVISIRLSDIYNYRAILFLFTDILFHCLQKPQM